MSCHGAWHGGWCWRDVRRGLEAAGATVFTPTLTGLGERRHLLSPQVSLDTHIADVAGLIEAEELSDIVLCGHSYAGMVITGVCDRLKPRIRHAVYLDAALPKDGQAMIGQNPDATAASVAAETAVMRSLAPDGLAMGAFDDLTILGVPADHPNAAWVRRRLTPHPFRTFTDPIRLSNGGSDGLPRTYVLCTGPVMRGASFQAHARRVKAGPTWRYAELATGHDAMITAPGAVTDLLLRAAA